MLATIFNSIGGSLIDKLIGPFTDLFKAYLNKTITMEELRAKLLQTLLTSVTEIEKSHSETLAKTYQSFMTAVVQSRLLKVAYVTVLFSQLAVLLWHQVGISALCYYTGKVGVACWPSSGNTVEWSYLLIGGLMGLGPIVLRSGPGKLDLEKLKAMIAR